MDATSNLALKLHDREHEAVRALGECIGYGRLIQLAHELWDETLGFEHSTMFELAGAEIILENDAKKPRTEAEVSAEFKKQLIALLKRWNAELEAKDHWTGYAECGQDVRMTVCIPGSYDAEHEQVRAWTEIDLGSYLHGDKQ
jgi:hypothetical protein